MLKRLFTSNNIRDAGMLLIIAGVIIRLFANSGQYTGPILIMIGATVLLVGLATGLLRI